MRCLRYRRLFSTSAWKDRANRWKGELHALYLACRDPRTPWYAKAVAIAVIAYALSPMDLIPDFIPVVGHLDDLLIVPLGICLAIRLIPQSVLQETRQKARQTAAIKTMETAGMGWIGAILIFTVWMVLLSALTIFTARFITTLQGNKEA